MNLDNEELKLLHLLVLFTLLFSTWLLLSGMFSAGFIAMGVISCLAVTILYKIIYKDKIEGVLIISFRTVQYCLWLIKEIAKSSLDVSLKMWQLEPEISPTTQWLDTNFSDEIAITIFANSITLTPGTVTIGTKGGMLHIHSLTENGVTESSESGMLERVKKLTKLKD